MSDTTEAVALGPLPEPENVAPFNGQRIYAFTNDQMRAYAAAEVARAVVEERERMREAMLDEAEVANREGFAEAAHWLEALAQKVGG